MEDNHLKLRSVRDHIIARLVPKHGARESRAIAETIMADYPGVSPVDVALCKDREISQITYDKIDCIVDRIINDDEPLQYILGHTRFYGANIEVTPATLIPRPETEELVDMIVDNQGTRSDLKVLDLCTGSGCIAVTLARVLKFASVEAVDLSDEALDIARKNAEAQGVKVDFSHADVTSWIPEGKFDIIVSNPPYVLQSERAKMDANVTRWEPAMALFVPDNDPLQFYRPIAGIAAGHLAEGGMLYLEINPLCATDLKSLLINSGLTDIEIICDMTGRQRFITARQK